MLLYPIIHTHEEKSSLTNTESKRVEFPIWLHSSHKNIILIDLMPAWAAVAILSFDVANIKSKNFLCAIASFLAAKVFYSIVHSFF